MPTKRSLTMNDDNGGDPPDLENERGPILSPLERNQRPNYCEHSQGARQLGKDGFKTRLPWFSQAHRKPTVGHLQMRS